jgi:hypothetical protein
MSQVSNDGKKSYSGNVYRGHRNNNQSSSSYLNPETKKRKILQMQKKNDIFIVFEESLLTEDVKSSFSDYFMKEDDKDNNISVDSDQENMKFPYLEVTTPTAGLIHWIRSKDNLNNGVLYNAIVSLLLPTAAIVVSCDDFCNRIVESENGLDFPSLDQMIDKQLGKVKKITDKHLSVKFVFIFVNLEKSISKLQRKVHPRSTLLFLCFTGFSQITDKSVPQLFDQACMHILFKYDIEVFRCRKSSDMVEYLHTISRTLFSTLDKAPDDAFGMIAKYLSLSFLSSTF